MLTDFVVLNYYFAIPPEYMHSRGHYVFTVPLSRCLSRCLDASMDADESSTHMQGRMWTRLQGGWVHYTHAAVEASYDHEQS